MGVKLAAASGGSIELVPTNTASDFTVTVPAVTGTMLTTATAGTVLQAVNYQTGAVATGTATIPKDDTIPQITEGTEFMTLAVTPISATSKLVIEVLCNMSPGSSGSDIIVALFQDSTANALAAVMQGYYDSAAGAPIVLQYYMTSGTTSSTTFRIRAGKPSGANPYTFNGATAGRLFGGVYYSSITITEIAA